MYINENCVIPIISGELDKYESKLVLLLCIIHNRTRQDKVLNLNSLDTVVEITGHRMDTLKSAISSLKMKNVIKIEDNSIYMVDADYWNLDR